jgi:hypothetical protein
MKISRIKAVTIFAVILMITSSLSIFAVSAHQPAISIPTYVQVAVAPNPVGVNQTVNFAFWNTLAPPEGASNSSIRWTFNVIVTDPDKQNVTLGTFTSDVDGRATAKYTPMKAGNWSVTVNFPKTMYTFNDTAAQSLWTGDTFLASSVTANFVVQEQPISEIATPLPAEFWVTGVGGNWFSPTDVYTGAGNGQTFGNHQLIYRGKTTGSLTGHVMWARSLEDGGQVGGSNVNTWGNTFYQGLAYNEKFRVDVVYVLDGKLYYKESFNTNTNTYSTTAGGYTVVDLRTGQEVFRSALTSLGMAYSSNGVSMFASTSFANLRDPYLNPMPFNLTGVPTTGTMAFGDHNEILRISVQNVGTPTSPLYNVLEWNSSRVIKPGLTGTVAAGGPEAYDYNVSITRNGAQATFVPSTTIRSVFVDDVLLLHNMTSQADINVTSPAIVYNIVTVSLNPATRGQIIGNINLTPNTTAPFNTFEQGDLTENAVSFEPTSRVLPFWGRWALQWVGLNTITGETWVSQPEDAWSYYASPDNSHWNRDAFISAGHLVDVSWGGILYAYDMTTGKREFTYGLAGKTVNANVSSAGFDTVYGSFPSVCTASTLSNGIIYTIVNEHSPNTPHLKRAMIRCIDVVNQKELWMLPSFGGVWSSYQMQALVTNGFTVWLNDKDQRIWATARGPSYTTVQVPLQTLTQGNKLIVEGTVIDGAAGTVQPEQAARFPSGVAAVSDDNMTAWMDYVYAHHEPRPDVIGVEVTLTATAADGTTENIGTTTSDSTGYYTINWTPSKSGDYQIVAKFAGTNAYYPSEATTTLTLAAPTEPTVTPSPTPAPTNDTYILASTAGIIAAIFVVAAVIILLSKRP